MASTLKSNTMPLSQQLMHSIIQRIATGPDLSKNISFDEAKGAMQAILKGEIDEVQSAIFLIALRMKRETMEENKGILAAILHKTNPQLANVDNLVDLGLPYSGYNRSIPISSFLPPLLAELGLANVIHGLDSVSPKYGLTHRHVNQALGLDVDLSPVEAKRRIEDPNIGWAYIDQANYCRELYDLIPLRNRIIKRSVINTIETLIGPIRGRKTHCVLGYVHKPYPPIYADLANFSKMDSSLLIRGIEGGVVPSLRQKGLMISYQGIRELARVDIDPSLLGVKQNVRAISFPEKMDVADHIPALAEYTVKLGKSALSGEKSLFYDGLVLSSSLILWHIKMASSLQEGAKMARAVLDSGKALHRIV